MLIKGHCSGPDSVNTPETQEEKEEKVLIQFP